MTKIHCPSCAARYTVPNEKLGKRVKCAKCSEPFLLAPPEPAAELSQEEDLFPDLATLQSGVPINLAPVAPPPPAPPSSTRGGRASQRAGASAAGGLAAYFDDVFLGFARILSQPWELLTIAAVCFICLLQIPIGFAPMGGAGKLIITGWYLSFLLKVVQSGANRENGLPDFALADGVVEDVILPCLSFLVVRLIAVVPLIGVLIYAVQDDRLEGFIATSIGLLAVFTPELAVITALFLSSEIPNLALLTLPPLLAGLAAVPMLVLVVAIAGISSLVRLDLMLATILRTLPGYVAATLIYFAALGLAVGSGFVVQQAMADPVRPSAKAAPAPAAPAPAATAPAAASDPNDPNSALAASPGGAAAARQPLDPNDLAAQFAGSLAAEAVTILVGVFASIFAMRAVGLYYAHYKRSFAWSWE